MVVTLVSVEQMREVDRLMTEEVRISLLQMMENAGRCLATHARGMLGGDARVGRLSSWQVEAAMVEAAWPLPGVSSCGERRSPSCSPSPGAKCAAPHSSSSPFLEIFAESDIIPIDLS